MTLFDSTGPLPDIDREPLDSVIAQLWVKRETEPDAVLEACVAARERARREENEVAELVISMTEAMAAYSARGTSNAAEIFPAVDARLAELGEGLWRIRLSRGVSVMHILRSETAQARELIEQGIALSREIGDTEQEAGGWLNLGSLERRLGNLPRALEHCLHAASLFEELAVSPGLAGVYGNIGLIHQAMGENDLALEYQRRALKVAEEFGEELMAARALSNIGMIHARKGEHERALEYFHRSLAIRRTTRKQLDIAISIGSVAGSEYHLGRYDDALAHYREALEIRKALNDRESIAMTLGNIGNVLRELGRHDEALELQTEALRIAEDFGMPSLTGGLHGYLVKTYEALGRHDLALEHIRAEYRFEREISGTEARRQVQILESTRQVELARKESEIERLRNVELAQALAQLKQAQTQLVHSEKMASLGQLTAGIAHEINNPVNFIGASVSPLRRDIRQVLNGELDDVERSEVVDEIEQLLDGIAEGATRTAEIVRGLRTFSRLDEDAMKLVDLRDGIVSTLALLRPRLGHDIRIELELEGLPPVDCRPGQINQAFMNILSNAIDAVGTEGTIRIAGARVGAAVRIVVCDSGCGMTADQLARIYEPFYTTKEVGKGTGLGLAITHSIIREHGGTIEFESTVGIGTTCTVTLPLPAGAQ
jgi:two-component system, NtrC family, sensor kinase